MNFETLLNIHGRMDWRDQDPQDKACGLCFDSRKVTPGSVYVAIRGTSADGHDFLEQAVASGASVVVVESLSQVPKNFQGGVLEVLDSRLSLQVLSQKFFENPGDQMTAIAVTGTNGKTSTTYLVEYLFSLVSRSCGVIGTIDHHIGDKKWVTGLTTPDPVTLQERLRDFLDRGGDSFVIEASSHALAQNRIAQGFDVTLFTNLSRDHLDYHSDMDDYFESKAKLFSSSMEKSGKDNFAIINGDDPYGLKLAQKKSGRQVFLFGQTQNCDFCFKIKEQNIDGSLVELRLPNSEVIEFQNSLVGLHNAYNWVGALASLYCLGYELKDFAHRITDFSGIPGRVQSYQSSSGVYGFVDYAHSPDALEKVIESLRKQVPESSKLITVFGCGGDRDQGKRPLMGEVGNRLSDKMVVTSDNPRTEDPQKIVDDILKGVKKGGAEVFVEVDRSLAIRKAVEISQPGDIILIAGKGHEDYQVLGHKKIHFSDYEQLVESFSDES